MFGFARRRHEGREPVEAGHDAVLDLAGRHLARPAHDHGTRKPPSSTVPLPPANGVWPPSGQVKFSAPLSVVNTTMVSFVETRVLELLHHRADDVVELRHAGFVDATSRSPALRIFSYLSERWVMTCMRVGLSQTKNGLPSFSRLVDELERVVEDLVVDRLHALRDQSVPASSIFCLPTLPQRGCYGRIVRVGRPANGSCCAGRPRP